MEEKKCCTVVNNYYGCSGGNGNSNGGNGSDSTPVGTVISYMGMKAPEHYLACNGAIYNIAEYTKFSDFIKEEYGSFNFFGGDGTTTFAVPDLRNEFLRGYHGDKSESLSGEIGAHQDGTVYPYYRSESNPALTDIWIGSYMDAEAAKPANMDSSVNNSKGVYIAQIGNSNRWITTSSFTNKPTKYTARPTNTAVLYCIKCE